MQNRHYNNRYERLQARRAPVISQPKVSSNHFHTCECRACWSCTEPRCAAFHQKKQKCVQCIKRVEELNSGQQEVICFEAPMTYAEYGSFMTFTDYVSQPNVLTKELIEASMKMLASNGWKVPEDIIKSVKQ